MATGNWSAKPGPQSDAGQSDVARGSETEFSSGMPSRKDGKMGTGSMKANEMTPAERVPKGRPRR